MTRREAILQFIEAAINAADVGAPLERERTAPITRAECPLIVMEPQNDPAAQTIVPKTDWTLTVLLTVCVRGGRLSADADLIIQKMHGAVMADQTQGGVAMDTQPGGVRYKYADADAGACDIECEYSIQYRTSQSDLSKP